MPRLLSFRVLLLALLTVGCVTLHGQATRKITAQAAPAQAPPASFALTTDRDPVLTLRGLFRFQPGDGSHWSDPNFDDSHWALVPGDRRWNRIGYPNLSGTAWYRFTVTLPPGDDPYALLLPYIYTCYQVFADGKLLLTIGKLPPHPALYLGHPEFVPLPSLHRSTPQTIHVALRIWQNPEWTNYLPGGITRPLTVGRADLLQDNFENYKALGRWRYSNSLDLGAFELIIACIALAFYAFRRTESLYLWLSLLTVGLSGNHLIRNWSGFHTYPVHRTENLEALSLFLFLIGSLLFFRELLEALWSWTFRLALLCGFLWFLNTCSTDIPGFAIRYENAGELLFSLPIYLWILALIYSRSLHKAPEARLLALPVSLMLVTAFGEQSVFTLATFGHPAAAHFYDYRLSSRFEFFFSPKDVGEAIFLVALLATLIHRFARNSREQDRIASELEAAREVQHVLVPESLPATPGLAIHTAYHPAQELGGDFFQILALPSGATLLVLGDVAGKGLPAALTVSLAVGTLRTLAEYTDSPADILAGLNRRLHHRGTGFTTCLALRFAPDTRSFTLANAGHLPPFLNGRELEIEPNLPLGLDPQATFVETTSALHPGDHLTVLTDGVPEAMHHHRLFGFDRTAALASQSAADIADAARLFGQADDITVLTIDVVPAPASATRSSTSVSTPSGPRLPGLLTALFLLAGTTHLLGQGPSVLTPLSAVDPHGVVQPSAPGIINLSSRLLQHPGDDPRFADPALDDTAWPSTQPSRSALNGGAQMEQFWYRTHVRLLPGARNLALRFGGFAGSEQLFVNGQLVDYWGRMSANGQSPARFDRYFSLPDQLLASGTLVIALRVHTTPSLEAFYNGTKLYLGPEPLLRQMQALDGFRSLTSNTGGLVIELLVLAIALALALSAGSEAEYRVLVALVAVFSFQDAFRLWLLLAEVPLSFWNGLVLGPVSTMADILLLEFLRRTFRLRNSPGYAVLYTSMLVAQVFYVLLTSGGWNLSGPLEHGTYLAMVLLDAPPVLAIPFLCLWYALRRRSADAFLLSFPLLFDIGMRWLGPVQEVTHLSWPVLAADMPIRSFEVGWSEFSHDLLVVALLLFLVLRTVRIARERASANSELHAAQTVQQLLLDRSSVATPGFAVETAYLPAQEVGGDFFYLSAGPDGSLLVLVGDVSGKGLRAAMTVSAILGALRLAGERRPAAVLQSLNCALCGHIEGFATCCAALLAHDGTLWLANAGNPAPYLDGEELASPPGLPLGLDPAERYEEERARLPVGGRLLFASDGVMEAMHPRSRQLFGFERTAALSTEHARTVAEAAKRFGQTDDITVLAVERLPVSVGEATAAHVLGAVSA